MAKTNPITKGELNTVLSMWLALWWQITVCPLEKAYH